VPKPPAPRVYHDDDLPPLKTHPSSLPTVVDLVYYLDLTVVVTGTEGSKLGETALLSATGDQTGVGLEHSAVL